MSSSDVRVDIIIHCLHCFRALVLRANAKAKGPRASFLLFGRLPGRVSVPHGCIKLKIEGAFVRLLPRLPHDVRTHGHPDFISQPASNFMRIARRDGLELLFGYRREGRGAQHRFNPVSRGASHAARGVHRPLRDVNNGAGAVLAGRYVSNL
jgi:hypothetical protein